MVVKRIFYIIAVELFLLCVVGCSSRNEEDSDDLNTLYERLDLELAESQIYQDAKEKKIKALRHSLSKNRDNQRTREITDRLIDEYESYVSDSALYYIGLALDLAGKTRDLRKQQELQLRRIDVMSHAGLFGDALNEIESFNRADLDSTLLEYYYYVNCDLYQYMNEYSNETRYSQDYAELRELYTDSIAEVASDGSFNRVIYSSNALISARKTREAKKMLTNALSEYEPGSRQYSIIASILAYAYKVEGDTENHKKYLVLSAISDIKGCTKENMSFRELSSELFKDGDIDRAKHYLQKSFDDANFYAARMRTAQSARMLTVIDAAYNRQQNSQQTRLKWLLILSSALSIALAIAFVFILKQIRRIRKANETIHEHNEELSAVSRELKAVNHKLEETNAALKSSDSIKEEYTGLFMVYSSLTIRNLENYQQTLSNLVIKGNTKDLLKKIKENSIVEKTLKDFYNKFDEAVLNIYPDFVEKVNQLMRPDEHIVPKPGSRLNTELRVLALIRIGVYDSERIAEFLRCSLTTVYTYRSKIRKRSLDPDAFEEQIRNINN